jgi:superfamily II DNA or RNA helicase
MNKKCVIQVTDEVNCRIVGLELTERKALMKMFEYDIPGARYLPAVRLGRWNGKISYFSLGGSTYVNLLEEIIPILDRAGYDIELEDSREYTTTFDFAEVTEETFKHKNWPVGHPIAGEAIVLRDYQVSVINGFLKNPQSIQVAPTGSGKTIITAALSHSVEQYGRSIVIVPNKSLVTQTEVDYVNLGLDVGVYYGDKKELGKMHTICTWQSLLSLIKNTKSGEVDFTISDFLTGVVCVICDEVHSVKADQLRSMLSGIMSNIPIRWGLTGTMPKEKLYSTALNICIGNVVNQLTASTLQDKGVLSNCHVNIVQFQDKVEFRDYQSELTHLFGNEKRIESIVKLLDTIKDSGNTLVLVDRISFGQTLSDLLPNSVFISGSTKGKDRQTEYDRIANVDGKVIIATYGIAAVGINVPRLFNVVLVEPGKSFVRTIQSIGRGLRTAHDKDHVDIWDLTSSCKFSKRHLVKRKEFYREMNYPFTSEKLDYL